MHSEPLPVGVAVFFFNSWRMVVTLRSFLMIAFGTNHGAFVSIRSAFDLNLSRMSR